MHRVDLRPSAVIVPYVPAQQNCTVAPGAVGAACPGETITGGVILCNERSCDNSMKLKVERAAGVDPAPTTWEAVVLPLYYARIRTPSGGR